MLTCTSETGWQIIIFLPRHDQHESNTYLLSQLQYATQNAMDFIHITASVTLEYVPIICSR